MSNITTTNFGTIAQVGEKVRVMYANGGSYYKWPDNHVIGKMSATVKFLTQPTGYFYMSKDANNSCEGNEIHWLLNGQNYCIWSDDLGYVAQPCTPYVFPLKEWINVEWSDSPGGSHSDIVVAGYPGRSVGIANWMYQGDVPYQHYIFSNGVNAYFRTLRTYDTNGVLRHNWDFQNGAGVPSGWSNCTIEEVKL